MKMESSFPANGNGYILYAEAAYNYAVLCVQLGRRKKAAKYFGIAHKVLSIQYFRRLCRLLYTYMFNSL